MAAFSLSLALLPLGVVAVVPPYMAPNLATMLSPPELPALLRREERGSEADFFVVDMMFSFWASEAPGLFMLAFCLAAFSRRARASPKARRWLLTTPAEGRSAPLSLGQGTTIVYFTLQREMKR